MSKLTVNNFQNWYCRQLPEGDNINNFNCRICRLVSKHNGEHVFTLLYSQ